MLYTRKGDNGTTKTIDSKPDERISKSSCRTESLGALDELNSFLGLVKVKASEVTWTVRDMVGSEVDRAIGNGESGISTATGKGDGKSPVEILMWVQNNLFIVQAETAGSDKRVDEDKIKEMESWIDAIEAELPPIKTFFISGGTELAALFDVARTMARKAERRVIKAQDEDSIKVGADTLSFLNRLSSLFYALARLSNHKSGIKEVPPSY